MHPGSLTIEMIRPPPAQSHSGAHEAPEKPVFLGAKDQAALLLRTEEKEKEKRKEDVLACFTLKSPMLLTVLCNSSKIPVCFYMKGERPATLQASCSSETADTQWPGLSPGASPANVDQPEGGSREPTSNMVMPIKHPSEHGNSLWTNHSLSLTLHLVPHPPSIHPSCLHDAHRAPLHNGSFYLLTHIGWP